MGWAGENQAGRGILLKMSWQDASHLPTVVPFQAHREMGSQAHGHIFSPVNTRRKNSHKVWCCLVQVAWFAAVITSADRLDLQTSILLISPFLRICTAKRVWIAGNIIDICWYCPRLSSSVCCKVKPGCSFPRQRFSQHFFTWTYDRNTVGCLVSLLGFLVSWLQILAFHSALQCRLDVASLSSVPGGSLQIPSP